MRSRDLEPGFDLLVIGAGTAGAAYAGLAAQRYDSQIGIIEAGPDYGPLSMGRWPHSLLHAFEFPGMPDGSHDWGYKGTVDPARRRIVPLLRAKVMGGCSSHNDCLALRGYPADYDQWAREGNLGWDWASIVPAFESAERALRVEVPSVFAILSYRRAFTEALIAAGITLVSALNESPLRTSVGPVPMNASSGVRWNSAFAYLDPVRTHENLTILDRALVDKIELSGSRAMGVEAIIDRRRVSIPADRIVLAAGAYSSPLILARSGIGSPDSLARAGVRVRHPLPGVGRGLQDHPRVRVLFGGGPRLSEGAGPHLKAPSQPIVFGRVCSAQSRGAFDLHIFPFLMSSDDGETTFGLEVDLMKARSEGWVEVTGTDPLAAPSIHHSCLADADDRKALVDGIRFAREVAGILRGWGWLVEEKRPGADVQTNEALERFIVDTVSIGDHPSCTCRMGPAADERAVVDASGRVHGLDNLLVCDASIFPSIPRANINLPTAMLSERLML